ncbi:DUF4350 domain-containing protein [Streptomyces sp. H27-D2]|uniref:DUF4350 domain-containing protein n=1 Tax=Streptomyces sp. H27-D2 TaxID=3046304 RepID=UPI002DB89ACD|nr:DUF4350 domain-containing protein [Streptomyces sp. H27-D2]MEC4019615.1 DUF4350 domain-containing protein [Streptomyces sp. H27-D2]
MTFLAPPTHTPPTGEGSPGQSGNSGSGTPAARHLWARARGPLLALALLLISGIVLAGLRSGEQHSRLDPRSADRNGSLAIAELLADQGVSTRVVTTRAAAASAADPDTTLLVTGPDLLTARQRTALHKATTGSGARTVLLAPGPAATRALAPGVRTAAPVSVTTRAPGCTLAAARRAGSAELGGARYTTATPDADACYLADGRPTLLRVPAPDGGDTVLLGSPDLLYNHRLDQHGNASLALQLLGSRPHLVWYLPSLSDVPPADGGDTGFFDLIPDGWRWGALQLAIAAALAALWRARRLGPLVAERLPVAVRASETTEGHARLYEQTKARGQAATVLRAATRARLARVVGVPPADADQPEALSPAVAARLTDAGSTVPAVHTLLFGAAPDDDAALVRLAGELHRMERAITSKERYSPREHPDR